MNTTTLAKIPPAIIAALKARFADRVTQYGWADPTHPLTEEAERNLQTPALIVEVEDFDIPEDDEDPEHRFPIHATLVITCWLSVDTQGLQLALPQFAAEVAQVVMPRLEDDNTRRGNRWGLGDAATEPQRCTSARAGFSIGLNGRDSREVRWEQTFYLSEERGT